MHIQVIDKRGGDIGCSWGIIPGQRNLQLGISGINLHDDGVSLTLIHLIFEKTARPQEIDGPLDPHRTVTELIVRPGTAQVLSIVRK